MGTQSAYFDHYKTGDQQELKFLDGKVFTTFFEAVIGADVAQELGYSVGDRIVVAHGIGAVSFVKHENMPFTVVGVLARTGTPVDRTIHVTLSSIEAIHQGWEGGAAPRGAGSTRAEDLAGLTLQPSSITAVFLGLTSRIGVLKAQRDLNEYAAEPLLAIIPGVALAQLWRVIGIVEIALTAISMFVILTGLFALMTNILTSLNERRREMAILRAIGAGVRHIFLLLVTEAALLAGAGAVSALALVQLVLWGAAPLIVEATGVSVAGPGISLFDVVTVFVVVLIACVLSFFPAWRAYRQSLADGLTVKV